MFDEVKKAPLDTFYLSLYKSPRSPYRDIVEFILREMNRTYVLSRQEEVFFSFRPRDIEPAVRLEIEKKIEEGRIEYKNVKGEIKPIEEMPKINIINISRTVLAWLYGSDLKKGEDYYFTGNKSMKYHVRVNQKNLSTLGIFPTI
jgi:hypothetical protein